MATQRKIVSFQWQKLFCRLWEDVLRWIKQTGQGGKHKERHIEAPSSAGGLLIFELGKWSDFRRWRSVFSNFIGLSFDSGNDISGVAGRQFNGENTC
jgi:hypothetical protein